MSLSYIEIKWLDTTPRLEATPIAVVRMDTAPVMSSETMDVIAHQALHEAAGLNPELQDQSLGLILILSGLVFSPKETSIPDLITYFNEPSAQRYLKLLQFSVVVTKTTHPINQAIITPLSSALKSPVEMITSKGGNDSADLAAALAVADRLASAATSAT